MGEMRKITVEVDAELLEGLQESTGEGVTELIRRALREFAHGEASRRILAMRGKLDLGLNLDELRKDKDEP